MRKLGGIAVPSRGSGGELSQYLIEAFAQHDYLNLAVTPEGSRSAREKWRRGFIYIALGAQVPVQLGVIDYKNKTVIIRDSFEPTGNIEHDMDYVKRYYAKYKDAAKYPDKFTY